MQEEISPRKKKAKLELQGIANGLIVMGMLLVQMAISKHSPPWWIYISVILLYVLAAFLGAAEVVLTDAMPRRRQRVMNFVKNTAWLATGVIPLTYIVVRYSSR